MNNKINFNDAERVMEKIYYHNTNVVRDIRLDAFMETVAKQYPGMNFVIQSEEGEENLFIGTYAEYGKFFAYVEEYTRKKVEDSLSRAQRILLSCSEKRRARWQKQANKAAEILNDWKPLQERRIIKTHIDCNDNEVALVLQGYADGQFFMKSEFTKWTEQFA